MIEEAQQALGNRGRILIRKSGTEPLLRIMVEADDEKLMHQLTDRLFAVISEFSSYLQICIRLASHRNKLICFLPSFRFSAYLKK